ncbi:hypothetical protein [Pantoea stewartii]|uniref:hypothetical protein n=1 Tax=Pantoea stewartii TaxID=66269 RepID=UPI00162A8451|nr:hypothetical protein [Pantoea stewartii]MBC0856458.1 hypothetical protein [Pantoea stewartii]
MADLVSVHFSNMSNQNFKRDIFDLSKGGNILDYEPVVLLDRLFISFTKSPASRMATSSSTGFTVAGSKGFMGISYEDLYKTSFDVRCVWQSETSGYRFGIKVHVAPQLFTFGTGPSWQVMYDNKASGSDPEWINPEGDQTEPYTFPVQGLQITATPVIESDSLNLDVYISNSKIV